MQSILLVSFLTIEGLGWPWPIAAANFLSFFSSSVFMTRLFHIFFAPAPPNFRTKYNASTYRMALKAQKNLELCSCLLSRLPVVSIFGKSSNYCIHTFPVLVPIQSLLWYNLSTSFGT